jgi:hypothetical protein
MMLSIDTMVMTVHDADQSRARFHSTTETYDQPDLSRTYSVSVKNGRRRALRIWCGIHVRCQSQN